MEQINPNPQQQGNQGQQQQQFQQQQQPAYNENEISTEDKTAAILTYFGLLGFIIAIVLHSQKKTRIGAYHMRQSLGMMIAAVALIPVYFILAFIPFVGWALIPIIGICFFVFWIIGLVNGIQGKFKPIPVLGPLFVKMLGTTFD
jgi:uncharacterized membrane protein